MNRQRLVAASAFASVVLALGATSTANAFEDFGDVVQGDTIFLVYDCPNDDNEFLVADTPTQTKVIDDLIPSYDDFLLGYPLDTSQLPPGTYEAFIGCADAQNDFHYAFTVVAADPCAPVESIVTPKGPGRAPHGAPAECEGSGIPDAGSDTSTMLLFASLAIVAGTGMLIARRRAMA